MRTTGSAVACASVILVLAKSASADDLTVPNTFQAGTPARASEVNENFTAVEASVDDNAANISANATNIQTNTDAIAASSLGGGITVFAQGVSIGRLVSGVQNTDQMTIVSDAGFVYIMSTRSANTYLGPSVVVYFSELDCTGAAYVRDRAGIGAWSMDVGNVVRSDGGTPVSAYYTPRGSAQVLGTPYASFAQNNSCTNGSGTHSLFAVFPNDEAITGVSSVAPSGPFTIGVP